MGNILLIGVALSSLLGAGAVGTMMTDYDIGMWSSNQKIIGTGGCPMMNDVEHCAGFTYEECGEMHEECEEHNHRYCEHDDFFEEDKRGWGGCPMRRR